MNESVGLGRIAGVRVGLNWTLLPVFLLIAWGLAVTLLPNAAPGYATWGYWVLALFTAVAFYASLLAHELAHAVVAQRHGIRVKSIVLWVFGGVAQLERDTPTARAELEVASAGPAMSFALAALGAVAAWLLDGLGVGTLMVAAVGWLAGINAMLGAFNLLPAFPLDGGRILRAILWRRWSDHRRATAVAAQVGRAGGFVLIAVGALEFLAGGGALGGIWLALIGWFITVAAGQQPELIAGPQPEPPQPPGGHPTASRGHTAELIVSDAMTANPLVVPAGASVADVIERYVLPSRFSAFPITDAEGRILGLATARRMAALPRESWPQTPIAAVAASRRQTVECGPHDRLADVATRLQASADHRAIVLEAERPVGILTPSDVERALSRTPSAAASAGGASHSRRPRGGFAWRPSPRT